MNSIKLLFAFIVTISSPFAMEVSYSLVDVSTNKVVEEKLAEKPMVLASVSKLYTTYFALKKIDPMERIKTEVLTSKNSQIKEGKLIGDLVIRPDGNPFMTAQNFIDLIYQIKRQGIQSISGDFVVATHGLWQTDRLDELGLEDQADNPGMGAFNFEFNRFNVSKSLVMPIPPMDYLNVTKKKIDNPGLKYKFVRKTSDQEDWIFNSTEHHKYREEVPTRDSIMFSAHFFRYLAGLHGLELPKPKQSKEDFKGRVLASQKSLSLSRLVELGLEYSNNLIAEMLLQRVFPGKTPKQAASLMLSWYKESFPGKDFLWGKTSLINGSGLTLNNLTTSKNLANLLAAIYQKNDLSRPFISYLSINGHSGGLRRRVYSPVQSFKIYGKTGSLFYVNNLSGYLVANSGKIYAYSIFTTDEKKRNILTQKNSKKVNDIREGNKQWYQKSSRKIDKLLGRMLKKY